MNVAIWPQTFDSYAPQVVVCGLILSPKVVPIDGTSLNHADVSRPRFILFPANLICWFLAATDDAFRGLAIVCLANKTNKLSAAAV